MAEFTLKPKEVETLRLNIGEGSYQVPLGGSLTRKEIAALDTREGTYEFLSKYIPVEVLDSLATVDYNQIVNVWVKETAKASGKTLGESRASQKR